jgi:hypothetical protein
MNPEIIFAVRYKGGSSGVGSNFWPTFAPTGSANRFLKVGTPVGYNNPTKEIMNLFLVNPNDKRTNVSFAVWQRTPSSALAYITKFVDQDISQQNQAENDWIVLRYADIKLLYAEILAQDGNHLSAHNPVNEIRRRAGLDDVGPFYTKDEALDYVYAERRLELAFENHRWFDLLRMAKSYNRPEKPVEVMYQHVFITDWDALYSKYTQIPLPRQDLFRKERLLLPIPQNEIDINNILDIPQNSTY